MSVNSEDCYFEKSAYEEFTFEFDFTPKMPVTGGTVSSCVGTAVEDDGSAASSVIVSVTVVPASTLVRPKVTGGTSGKNYMISLQAVLSSGEKVEGFALMGVRR